MSLKDSCFTKSLLRKFVNTQLLMTIGGGGGIQSLNVKMSPAPPSSTISNDLRSNPFEASNGSKASFQTLDSSDSSKSALLQLAKEFNKFYFNGKKKYINFFLIERKYLSFNLEINAFNSKIIFIIRVFQWTL